MIDLRKAYILDFKLLQETRSGVRAFSSEVDTGSREENASNKGVEPPFRFNRNGKGSRIGSGLIHRPRPCFPG
jgi:hypothetical protein